MGMPTWVSVKGETRNAEYICSESLFVRGRWLQVEGNRHRLYGFRHSYPTWQDWVFWTLGILALWYCSHSMFGYRAIWHFVPYPFCDYWEFEDVVINGLDCCFCDQKLSSCREGTATTGKILSVNSACMNDDLTVLWRCSCATSNM